MKKFTFLLLLLLGLQSQAISQNYVTLSDISGLGTVADLSDLKAAADEVIAALPTEFQNQFKVFSGGFYVYNEFLNGNTPAYWDKLKEDAQAQSPYYLLYAKESSPDGICQRFWVDLKLPSTGAFQCMDDNYFDIILSQVSDPVNTINTNAFSPMDYADAEVSGINNLKSYVTRLASCCASGSWNPGCGNCIVDYNEMVNFFENKGFLEIINTTFTITSANYNGNLQSNFEISYLDGQSTVNLTQDLNEFLGVYEITGPVQARVTKFTESNCDSFSTYSELGFNGFSYTEEIIIIDYNSTPRVFFRADADAEGNNVKPNDDVQRGPLLTAAKSLLKTVFKRIAAAGTGTAGTAIGVGLEYAIEGIMELWFDPNEEYEGTTFSEVTVDYFWALWATAKRKGVKGFGTSVAQNAINGPIINFATSFVRHFIDKPTSQWDPLQALKDGLIAGVLTKVLSPGAKNKFPEANKLMDDLDSTDGLVLLGKCFKDKKLFKAWKKALDDDLPAKVRKSDKAMAEIKKAIDDGLDPTDAITDAIQTARKQRWDAIKHWVLRGRNFNDKGRAKYAYNEIVLAKQAGDKAGKRLDTYVPPRNGEPGKIISRKATDIDNIKESTWRQYCNELVKKYKVGTPVNSSKLPSNEPPLSGGYYLEIPSSNQTAEKLEQFKKIAATYGKENGGIKIIFLAE